MDRKREGNEGCHIFFQWISHLSRKVETETVGGSKRNGRLQSEILSGVEGVIVRITAGYRVSTESEQVYRMQAPKRRYQSSKPLHV